MMKLLALDARLDSMSYTKEEIGNVHDKNIILRELDSHVSGDECRFESAQESILQTLGDDV